MPTTVKPESGGLTVGAIIGIVSGVVLLIALIVVLFILYRYGRGVDPFGGLNLMFRLG